MRACLLRFDAAEGSTHDVG